jgi:hypothetical protein
MGCRRRGCPGQSLRWAAEQHKRSYCKPHNIFWTAGNLHTHNSKRDIAFMMCSVALLQIQEGLLCINSVIDMISVRLVCRICGLVNVALQCRGTKCSLCTATATALHAVILLIGVGPLHLAHGVNQQVVCDVRCCLPCVQCSTQIIMLP